eukprot:TRINITY_DN66888_c4_g6_i2.p1 TRINITY_DN66888_c4_g6~~TRINITY_DN66888_c4_g6_i2.p1  ORF type:complete len:364 (-),score=24.25 TRINITY_DN66888_c4_g6_i2:309-1400(-)
MTNWLLAFLALCSATYCQDVVLVGTNQLDFQQARCYVWKSKDGGATYYDALVAKWTNNSFIISPCYDGVMITPKHLLVVTDFGLLQSTDGGAHFATVPSPFKHPFSALKIAADDSKQYIAALGNVGGGQCDCPGVQYSHDGGKTWKGSLMKRPNDYGGIAWATGKTFFATLEDYNLQVWKSTDGCVTWKKVLTSDDNVLQQPMIKFYGKYGTVGGDWTYFSGSKLVYFTEDFGENWKSVNITKNCGASDDLCPVALPNGKLRIQSISHGNSGACYSDDNGKTWTISNPWKPYHPYAPNVVACQTVNSTWTFASAADRDFWESLNTGVTYTQKESPPIPLPHDPANGGAQWRAFAVLTTMKRNT